MDLSEHKIKSHHNILETQEQAKLWTSPNESASKIDDGPKVNILKEFITLETVD